MKKRQTTKDKILELLKKEVKISMKDLSEHFTISEVALRRHINDLIRQNLVQEEEVKQEIGRPYFVYSLTREGHNTFPNQYDQLPVELLRDLEDLYGKEAIEKLLQRRKEREEKELSSHLEGLSFDEKVEKLFQFLEQKGYMLEYEKTDEGNYEIKNYHCPIYNISSNYNQVCRYEKELYKTLFPDSEVTDRSCMSKGNHHCYWVITNPEAKKAKQKS